MDNTVFHSKTAAESDLLQLPYPPALVLHNQPVELGHYPQIKLCFPR